MILKKLLFYFGRLVSLSGLCIPVYIAIFPGFHMTDMERFTAYWPGYLAMVVLIFGGLILSAK